MLAPELPTTTDFQSSCTMHKTNYADGDVTIKKSHCGDKTILRPSYLHNAISYTGKMRSLYWIGTLILNQKKLTSQWQISYTRETRTSAQVLKSSGGGPSRLTMLNAKLDMNSSECCYFSWFWIRFRRSYGIMQIADDISWEALAFRQLVFS